MSCQSLKEALIIRCRKRNVMCFSSNRFVSYENGLDLQEDNTDSIDLASQNGALLHTYKSNDLEVSQA